MRVERHHRRHHIGPGFMALLLALLLLLMWLVFSSLGRAAVEGALGVEVITT